MMLRHPNEICNSGLQNYDTPRTLVVRPAETQAVEERSVMTSHKVGLLSRRLINMLDLGPSGNGKGVPGRPAEDRFLSSRSLDLRAPLALVAVVDVRAAFLGFDDGPGVEPFGLNAQNVRKRLTIRLLVVIDGRLSLRLIQCRLDGPPRMAPFARITGTDT